MSKLVDKIVSEVLAKPPMPPKHAVAARAAAMSDDDAESEITEILNRLDTDSDKGQQMMDAVIDLAIYSTNEEGLREGFDDFDYVDELMQLGRKHPVTFSVYVENYWNTMLWFSGRPADALDKIKKIVGLGARPA